MPCASGEARADIIKVSPWVRKCLRVDCKKNVLLNDSSGHEK